MSGPGTWIEETRAEESRPLAPGRRTAGIERLLWAFAAVTLGIALWMKADAWIYQLRFQDLARLPTEVSEPSGPAAGAPAGRFRPPLPEGTPLAHLSIPRLDLAVVVAEGTSHRVLRRAVGHLPRSARPGEGGNIALAGHRDTFFRALAEVQVGDQILLETDRGREAYRVEWTRVVKPDAVDVVEGEGYPAVTLVTCYPFRYLGNAPERYVVRARRLEEEGSTRDRGSAPSTAM